MGLHVLAQFLGSCLTTELNQPSCDLCPMDLHPKASSSLVQSRQEVSSSEPSLLQEKYFPFFNYWSPLPQVDFIGPRVISVFLPFGEPLGGTWVRSSFCLSKYQLSVSWWKRTHLGEALTILVPCRSRPKEGGFPGRGNNMC